MHPIDSSSTIRSADCHCQLLVNSNITTTMSALTTASHLLDNNDDLVHLEQLNDEQVETEQDENETGRLTPVNELGEVTADGTEPMELHVVDDVAAAADQDGQLPDIRIINETPLLPNEVGPTSAENCQNDDIPHEQETAFQAETEDVDSETNPANGHNVCSNDGANETEADVIDNDSPSHNGKDTKLDADKPPADDSKIVEKPSSLQSKTVSQSTSANTRSKGASSAAKTGPAATRLSTEISRRPSAPLIAKTNAPSVRTVNKNNSQNSASVTTKPTPTIPVEPSKQNVRNVRATRASIDLGQTSSKVNNAPAQKDSTSRQPAAAANKAADNGSATRRRGSMAWSKSSASGNATPPKSQQLSANSSGTAGHRRQRSDSSNNPSLLGSASDVSSLDASHNGSVALSQTRTSANGLVKAETTAAAAANKRNTGTNASSAAASKRLTASRGSIGGRTDNDPPSSTVRKGPSTTARNSVLGTSATSKQQQDVRRASVTTSSSPAGNVHSTSTRSTTTTNSTAAASNSRTSSRRPSVAADSTDAPTEKSAANAAGRTQQSHRPDVVSNTVIDEKSSLKIAQLEALCETKTKELIATRNELTEKIKWFEAMALVANYFVSQLKCGTCEKLTIRLEEVAEKFNDAKQHLEELTTQRDALINEIQNIKQKEEQERENMRQAHEEMMKKHESDLQAKYEADIQKVVNEHSQHIVSLEAAYDEQLSALHKEYAQELSDKETEMDAQVEQLKLQQEAHLVELKIQHENQLVEITERCENIKQSLSEQVEYLRVEKEDLRRREILYMEECQRKADMMIQSSLGPYSQELDSMKAVVELRNNELRDMRLQNMELQCQMEELSGARETIKRLQQKVENLEAVISIRTDYEKQLAEKHQQLLRKYEQETKANKRLSMDKEELMWRLAQGDAVPEPSRRSLSHSPTAAVDHPVTGAPSPTIKFLTMSDTPPVSSAGRTTFGNATTPNATVTVNNSLVKLRRSGTYDLLDKTDNDVFD